jgi:hypothetical protein
VIARISLLALVACSEPTVMVKAALGPPPPRAALMIETPAALPGARVALRWSIADQQEGAELGIRSQAPGLVPPPDDLEPGSLRATGPVRWLTAEGAWVETPAIWGAAQALGSTDVELSDEGEWRFDLMLYEAGELVAIDSAVILVSERQAIRARADHLTVAGGRSESVMQLVATLERPDGSLVSLLTEGPDLRFAYVGPAMSARIPLPAAPGNHRVRADLIELENGVQIAGASASWVTEELAPASDGLPQPAVLARFDASALGDEVEPAMEAFAKAVAKLRSEGLAVFTRAERTAELMSHAERLTREDLRPPARLDAILDFAVADPEEVLPLIRGAQQRPIAPRLSLSLSAEEVAVGERVTATFRLEDADGSGAPDQSIAVRHGVNGGDELSTTGRTDVNGMLVLELPAAALDEIHAVEGSWTQDGVEIRSSRAWYRAVADGIHIRSPLPSLRVGETAELTVVARGASANQVVSLAAQRGTVPAEVTTGADGTATFIFTAMQPGLGRITASSAVGSGSTIMLVESPVVLSVAANGDMIEVSVERGVFNCAGVAVELSASAGSIEPARAVTGIDGIARATFVAPGGSGSAILTARVDLRGDVTEAETTLAY